MIYKMTYDDIRNAHNDVENTIHLLKSNHRVDIKRDGLFNITLTSETLSIESLEEFLRKHYPNKWIIAKKIP